MASINELITCHIKFLSMDGWGNGSSASNSIYVLDEI